VVAYPPQRTAERKDASNNISAGINVSGHRGRPRSRCAPLAGVFAGVASPLIDWKA
jgi:hypothetical protein